MKVLDFRFIVTTFLVNILSPQNCRCVPVPITKITLSILQHPNCASNICAPKVTDANCFPILTAPVNYYPPFTASNNDKSQPNSGVNYVPLAKAFYKDTPKVIEPPKACINCVDNLTHNLILPSNRMLPFGLIYLDSPIPTDEYYDPIENQVITKEVETLAAAVNKCARKVTAIETNGDLRLTTPVSESALKVTDDLLNSILRPNRPSLPFGLVTAIETNGDLRLTAPVSATDDALNLILPPNSPSLPFGLGYLPSAAPIVAAVFGDESRFSKIPRACGDLVIATPLNPELDDLIKPIVL